MESANCTSFKGSFPDCFENLPCCFYVVQSQEPFPLLYANRETLRLFDCRDLEELRRHINNDGLNIFAPEDRERSFQEIMRELAEKNGRFPISRAICSPGKTGSAMRMFLAGR